MRLSDLISRSVEGLEANFGSYKLKDKLQNTLFIPQFDGSTNERRAFITNLSKVFLGGILSTSIPNQLYAGSITDELLPKNSWFNNWIENNFKTYAPEVNFIWKENRYMVPCGYVELEELITEGLAYVHHSNRINPTYSVNVVMGVEKPIPNSVAAFEYLENEIHLSKFLVLTMAQDYVTIPILLSVIHEGVHWIDQNYFEPESFEIYSKIRSWGEGTTIPRLKKEVDIVIDKAKEYTRLSELKAFNTEKDCIEKFLPEISDPLCHELLTTGIEDISTGLKLIKEGKYFSLIDLERKREIIYSMIK